MIFNSVEKSTALHDKRILKAQCEILKHALPQTFIDTILVKETTTLTTAYSVTIPKIIQCMTFETKTETVFQQLHILYRLEDRIFLVVVLLSQSVCNARMSLLNQLSVLASHL